MTHRTVVTFSCNDICSPRARVRGSLTCYSTLSSSCIDEDSLLTSAYWDATRFSSTRNQVARCCPKSIRTTHGQQTIVEEGEAGEHEAGKHAKRGRLVRCNDFRSEYFTFAILKNLPSGTPVDSPKPRIAVNLSQDESLTQPSHSQTSRLLISPLSLGVPVPHATQCMRGV
jgi:hypothetical protein